MRWRPKGWGTEIAPHLDQPLLSALRKHSAPPSVNVRLKSNQSRQVIYLYLLKDCNEKLVPQLFVNLGLGAKNLDGALKKLSELSLFQPLWSQFPAGQFYLWQGSFDIRWVDIDFQQI